MKELNVFGIKEKEKYRLFEYFDIVKKVLRKWFIVMSVYVYWEVIVKWWLFGDVVIFF